MLFSLLSDFQAGPVKILLWFSRVDDLTADNEEYITRLFSSSERKRLQLTTSIKKQKEYLQSRILMRRALAHVSGLDEKQWSFTERSFRPPAISNLPDGIFYSLTHSDGLICFALANCVLGVDLELFRVRKNLQALAATVMSHDEQQLLKGKSALRMFYRMWCAKEAYYKTLPGSEQSGFVFRNYSLFLDSNVKRFFYHTQIDQCMFSLVTESVPEQVQCYPESMDIQLATLAEENLSSI